MGWWPPPQSRVYSCSRRKRCCGPSCRAWGWTAAERVDVDRRTARQDVVAEQAAGLVGDGVANQLTDNPNRERSSRRCDLHAAVPGRHRLSPSTDPDLSPMLDIMSQFAQQARPVDIFCHPGRPLRR